MNTSAIILISIVWISVTWLTGYFFVKVLRTPKKPEPDSFTDNDDKD